MAENLQEYYKRMAEAIDTQLEQKGKAALFYPVGSGSGRIVWAWINAHPDAAVIWVVPGETRRGMRLEEAKRIGQEIPPRVEYQITTLGLTLQNALSPLADWMTEYGDQLER